MSGVDDYDSMFERDDDDADARGDDVASTDARIKPFPNPPIELCPVIPLGFFSRNVVFAMPEGEIRIEQARQVGQMINTDIFACEAGQSFLVDFRDTEDGKFQRDVAARWFIRHCRKAGRWDTRRTQRGPGVWPAGDSVMLHRGEQLLEVTRSGRVNRMSIAQALRQRGQGPLYTLAPPTPEPVGGFSVEDGAWVREMLGKWEFEALGASGLSGADVVLGWVGAAMLGAVAPFRGHVLIQALAGSGKTTLMHFLQALVSGLTTEVIDEFTDAGLRGDLAGVARPVLLDEAETAGDQPGGGVVSRMLEIIRRMSTGTGSNRKQGAADGSGGVTTQTAVGSVIMAAINPPRLGPADASRIVEVRLFPLRTGAPPYPAPPGWRPPATAADIEAATETAAEFGPALLGRALRGAWRYREDAAAVKTALTALGQDPRTADLVAMLAAGRRLLLADDGLDGEGAAEEVAFWAPLLTQRIQQDRVTNVGADALAHLMAWSSGQHVNDRVPSIGELVAREVKPGERGNYLETLKNHGLIVDVDLDDERRVRLLVANNHPGLTRIFKGTSWPDWNRALANLDVLGPEYQTEHSANSRRFGSVAGKQRYLAIPLTPWVESLARGGGGTGAFRGGVPEEDDVFP